MNKKIISILILLVFILIMTSSVFAHPGDKDSYGGHYIKGDCDKCIGYHYHEGDFLGWQLNLNTYVKWNKRSQLNQFKPFDPNVETALGEWVQVEFDVDGNVINVITPTPEETETATPENTETTTPENTETATPENTETITPVETPDQDVTAFETEIDLTTTASEEDELPQTGEGFGFDTLFVYIIAFTCVGLGIYLIFRRKANK